MVARTKEHLASLHEGLLCSWRDGRRDHQRFTEEQALQSAKDRLFGNVKISEKGCWEYTRCIGKNGYACLRFQGHTKTGHRLAYQIVVGEIPKGLFVCHHCDNRKCVNPNHLFLGTNSDNLQDAKRKGRLATGPCPERSGERHSNAKLTNENVREIRKLLLNKIPQKQIADKFNITRCQISAIATGREWSSVK